MYRGFEIVKTPEYFGDRGTIVYSAALILFIFVRVSIYFYWFMFVIVIGVMLTFELLFGQ